ncbi:MAG: DUF554 domain-containing protein [Sphaerochaeta sp.]|nr:DUF554 domain-containing protein [Sphaerochaeta sp.]
MIPYGILVNSSVIILGGLLGILLKKHISENILDTLPPIFGLSALGIGITSTIKMETLSVVILSLIIGTIVGELSKLELQSNYLLRKMGRLCLEENRELFLTLVVLFCASGTGIFGSLNAGMTGDHSILYAKSILDFFTAFSFATVIGIAIIVITIPQFIVQYLLFLIALLFLDQVSQSTLANFQAVGGLITVGIGLNILKITKLKVINMIPGLLMVFPITYLKGIFF